MPPDRIQYCTRPRPAHLIIIVLQICIAIYSLSRILATIEIAPIAHHEDTALLADDTRNHSTTANVSSSLYPLTIVTAYFKLNDSNSKHKFTEYNNWMRNWLPYVSHPVVIYTNDATLIRSIRPDNDSSRPTRIINMSLSEIPLYNQYFHVYQKQHAMDPLLKLLGSRHSPQLYLIYAAKAFFLYQVSNVANPFSSTYFMWVDIGSFRFEANQAHSRELLQRHGNWPNMNVLRSSFAECNASQSCIIVGLVNHNWLRPDVLEANHRNRSVCPYFMHSHTAIQGGFLLGTASSFRWWKDAFFAMHDLFIQRNVFVGRDEVVMFTLFLRNPDLEILLLDTTDARGCGQDKWWYFQLYFAVSEEDDEQKAECVKTLGLRPVGVDDETIGVAREYYIAHYPKCATILS